MSGPPIPPPQGDDALVQLSMHMHVLWRVLNIWPCILSLMLRILLMGMQQAVSHFDTLRDLAVVCLQHLSQHARDCKLHSVVPQLLAPSSSTSVAGASNIAQLRFHIANLCCIHCAPRHAAICLEQPDPTQVRGICALPCARLGAILSYCNAWHDCTRIFPPHACAQQ